jgi:hypothetical protein
VPDPYVRKALEEIDPFLRDIGPALAAIMPSETGTSSSLPDTASYLVLANHAALSSERRLTVAAPILAVDGGPGTTFALSLSLATPAFTFSTTAAPGGSSSLVRSDAQIAIFDATSPADAAAAASHGSTNFAADAGHVHKFPTSLRSTANAQNLTLTGTSGTVQTLSISVTNLDLSGITSLRPATTGTINVGTAGRRFADVQTNGLTVNGDINQLSGSALLADVSCTTLTISVGYNDHFLPAVDATLDFGETGTPLRWRNAYLTGTLNLKDSGVDYFTKLASNSSGNLSADRTLTFDVADGDRTLRITGNPTIADWFDQDVKTTGTPQFSKIGVGMSPGLTQGIRMNDSYNIQVGTATGTLIGTGASQKLGFFGVGPVAQQAGTGTTTGHSAGGGTAVDDASTFTGNTGSTAYTIGDVVKALKNLGLMAA